MAATPPIMTSLTKAFIGPRVAMFILGIAQGLPYALLTGTVMAWLSNAVDTSTIGILSWGALAYAFKFIWSPVVSTFMPVPFKEGGPFGRWRAWMIFTQIPIVIALFFIANIEAGQQLGLVALLIVIGTFSAATNDIAIDAWRIKASRTSEMLDTLSTLVQLGFRSAAFMGGFFALIFAARLGWQTTWWIMAIAMTLCFISVLFMPDVDESQSAKPSITLGVSLGKDRHKYLIPVLIAWGISISVLFGYMFLTVTAEDAPSTRNFTLYVGPLIILACVGTPALMSALLLKRDETLTTDGPEATSGMDILWANLLEPMIDLIRRLRWSAFLILGLVLTYRYADMVWGAFAYPFYLGAPDNNGGLGHTLDEVAAASKFFGVIMTILGTAGAGAVLAFLGRMNALVIGAILAAATNLLYADLAAGGANIEAFISFMHLETFFNFLNIPIQWIFNEGTVTMDSRLQGLMVVIAGENLVVGFASVVYVAYLSSIVNKRYAAVQYALLASLTMLIGAIGRPLLGELIEERGFAYVFVLTALLGCIGVAFSLAEWIRQRGGKKPAINME